MDILSQDEAAEMLHISVNTLRQWRYRGEGPPYIQVGKSVVYDRASVEAWLKSREVGTDDEMD